MDIHLQSSQRMDSFLVSLQLKGDLLGVNLWSWLQLLAVGGASCSCLESIDSYEQHKEHKLVI